MKKLGLPSAVAPIHVLATPHEDPSGTVQDALSDVTCPRHTYPAKGPNDQLEFPAPSTPLSTNRASAATRAVSMTAA